MSRLLILLLLILAPIAALAADDPEVEQLFKQLSDDDFKTRESARKELIDRGEAAIPQIKALAEKAQDPETRTAVTAILEQIDARSINGPSLITLDMKDAPAKDVVDAIATQGRTELAVWPDDVWGQIDKKTLTIKVTRQPFWAVMRDVLPQLGLQLNAHGPRERFQLMRGTAEMGGPAHVSGPFMAVATGANESRSVNYSQAGARQQSLQINVNVFVEPKLRLLSRDFRPQIEEFVDDAGHSLLTARGQFSRHMSNARESMFTLNIAVPDVEGRTKRIARLKGSVPVVLMTKSERIEIPEIMKAKGTSQTKGDWTIKVNDVTVDAASTAILNVTFLRNAADNADESQTPEWKRTVGFNSLTLQDADGRILDKQGHSMSGDGKKWDGNFQFRRGRGAGEPAKLVWEFPVEAEEVQIPFEFKDLPLP